MVRFHLLTTDNWPLATRCQREGVCTVWRQPPPGGNSYKEQHYALPEPYFYGAVSPVLCDASIRARRRNQRRKLGRDYRRILDGDRLSRLRPRPRQGCRVGDGVAGPQPCRPSGNSVRTDSWSGADRVAGAVYVGDYFLEGEVGKFRVSGFKVSRFQSKSKSLCLSGAFSHKLPALS